jgi:hypothetical protein
VAVSTGAVVVGIVLNRPSVQHMTHIWFTIQTILMITIIVLIVQRVVKTVNVGKVQQVQQMGRKVSVQHHKNVLQHMVIV